jgi:hypothetical protein
MTFPTLILNSDSTFQSGVAFCVGGSDCNGTWTTNDQYLLLHPIVPNGIHFDQKTRRFVYDQETKVGSPANDIEVRSNIVADYSEQTFRIKRAKLFQQFASDKKTEFSKCPYYMVPADTIEARRLQRIYEIKCSDLGPFQKLLVRTGLLK